MEGGRGLGSREDEKRGVRKKEKGEEVKEVREKKGREEHSPVRAEYGFYILCVKVLVMFQQGTCCTHRVSVRHCSVEYYHG